jgi:hypothetical protein
MSDDKTALVEDIENLPAFQMKGSDKLWDYWEKLLGGGKLRGIDLMHLRGIIDKAFDMGREYQKEIET